MKTKQICIVLFAVIAVIAFCNVSYGQDKSVYNSELLDLGDGKIIISTLNESDDFVIQEIIVEVEKAGKYYLAAWVNGGLYPNGEKLDYSVSVNDEKEEYKIGAEKSYPHAVDFGEQMFDLVSGVNRISFKTRKPFCPNVEFIKVSQDAQDRQISSEKYDQFIEEISNQKKAVTAPSSASGLKYTLSNPGGNYNHEMDVNFKYSYYTTLLLNDDETYTFETTNATGGTDPVIHLINTHDPSISWTDDNGAPPPDNVNAKLTVDTEWYAGYYYLFIRKAGTSEGTCNLKMDGTTIASNCAVWGSRIECETDNEGTLNWFTADLNDGDSHIWLENTTGNPGKIIKYNDDWTVSSDFNWGNNSRISKNVYKKVRAIIVSSHSSYNPDGNCDLYMNCKNSTITSYFPNLKSNDAIQSAPYSGTYNCISWSGGITNYWEWPPSPYSDYYVSGNPLASFDNFYGSSRYYDAMTYSRSGATSSNRVVDLWALNGSYTHGSVTKPGNNHPHGYNWESKPGSLMRTFHPRNALNGSSYGSVSKYYKTTSLKSAMLLDESIARGLSVIENVELTDNEKLFISESIGSLSTIQRNELERRYIEWKQTWDEPELAIQSNPRMYANSKEYNEFIKYCKVQGESVWPYIFDKFQQGDYFVINALEDLTLEDNQDVLEKVKKEGRLKSTSETGAAIVRSPRTIAMKYIKELLKSLSNVNSIDDGITYSNSIEFNVYPNPVDATSQLSFDLPTEAKVSAQVIDLNGRILSVVINKQELNSGNQIFSLNVPESFTGTCLVKLLVNNNVNVRLVVVQ